MDMCHIRGDKQLQLQWPKEPPDVSCESAKADSCEENTSSGMAVDKVLGLTDPGKPNG
ncbi:hypothetical protein SESBI_16462 [Sesbania bispinosa]|nr:hypothetical protein SESBI_16462 [Sesbania bispinosa]